MKNNLIQAYRQAPWRTQLQVIAYFLLVLVAVALVVGLYLSISGQTATIGAATYALQRTRDTIQRENADLGAQIADLTSNEKMEPRANGLGLVPAEPAAVQYIEVEGYAGRQPALYAQRPQPAPTPQPLLKPQYTQSLWEWFFQGVSLLNKGVK